MASKSNLPTGSTWDQDDDQLETDNNLSLYPATAQPIDQNDSYDESLLSEDDGDDDELYGLLQTASTTDPTLSSNTTTTGSTTDPRLSLSTASEDVSETLLTTSSPLSSPASQLAGVTLPQLHIHSSSQTDVVSTQHFTYPYPPSAQTSLDTRSTGKRSSSSSILNSRTKRTDFRYNPESQQVKPLTTVTYIAEQMQLQTSPQPSPQIFTMRTPIPKDKIPEYYPDNYKIWENRPIFKPDTNLKSPTGLPRVDLYVYAIDANTETKSQCEKKKYRRRLTLRNTPIERFYPEIWDAEHKQLIGSQIQSTEFLRAQPFFQEPYENALSVDKNSLDNISKVAPAIPEPLNQLHPDPPSQQHTLSQQGRHLVDCEEPVDFFDAIYSPHQIESLLHQTILYRNQKGLQKWQVPTYNEMRCFIGLLLWTSLAQFPNRRAYFHKSAIYNLPHFTAHTSRDRFEQLLTMLHFTDNENIPQDLGTARRFEAKLANQLTDVNHNSAKLLTPARALSIDEMMVKLYGRSVLRQYMPAKPNKYGIKLWAVACACCGYSLTQNIYLGSSVQSVGGRDVVLQLAEPYFEKGHVIYCDRFFSHLDLAAYLRSRQTGMIGTADITSLEQDLKYLVTKMHPLTWAYKWYSYKANFTHRTRAR